MTVRLNVTTTDDAGHVMNMAPYFLESSDTLTLHFGPDLPAVRRVDIIVEGGVAEPQTSRPVAASSRNVTLREVADQLRQAGKVACLVQPGTTQDICRRLDALALWVEGMQTIDGGSS